jgi:hypothetical protein
MWLFMPSTGNPATAGEGGNSNGYWTRQGVSITFTIPATATAYVGGSNQTVSTVGGWWKVRQAPTSGGADAFSNYLGPTP